ncbi:hypothetical protein [Streptomyces sp. M2CJ-2]|uniref:hypothetical protein n=1 Tax=Streptomyces sp. M2CJ-2 TaxID=2803948 RepID=UPI001F1B7D21|nr:hypothetical protein [Streptomyces sp. M2CJ-2]
MATLAACHGSEHAPDSKDTVAVQSLEGRGTAEHHLQAAAAADRKRSVHERLRHRLPAQLWEHGQPEDDSVVDIVHVGDHGTYLFEVPHAEQPTCTDLREAATRTAEVRFAAGRAIDQIFLDSASLTGTCAGTRSAGSEQGKGCRRLSSSAALGRPRDGPGTATGTTPQVMSAGVV